MELDLIKPDTIGALPSVVGLGASLAQWLQGMRRDREDVAADESRLTLDDYREWLRRREHQDILKRLDSSEAVQHDVQRLIAEIATHWQTGFDSVVTYLRGLDEKMDRLMELLPVPETSSVSDSVYGLAAEGKLPSTDDRDQQLTATLLGTLSSTSHVGSQHAERLLDEAIEILTAASEGRGTINAVTHDAGFIVIVGNRQFNYGDDNRKTASLRRAIQQLDQMDLIEGDGKHYEVSHDGYQLVDNLISASSLKQ